VNIWRHTVLFFPPVYVILSHFSSLCGFHCPPNCPDRPQLQQSLFFFSPPVIFCFGVPLCLESFVVVYLFPLSNRLLVVCFWSNPDFCDPTHPNCSPANPQEVSTNDLPISLRSHPSYDFLFFSVRLSVFGRTDIPEHCLPLTFSLTSPFLGLVCALLRELVSPLLPLT